MNKTLVMAAILFLGCYHTTKKDAAKNEVDSTAAISTEENPPVYSQKVLPKQLKEISGMITDGKDVWVISDKPKSVVYKLDTAGNILQEIKISNLAATDVEAITADEQYLYVGDIGDNDGNRTDRVIMKIKKSDIGKGDKVTVTAESISFTFPDETVVKKKKKNNFDAEALLSFKDSLFVFTKRRGDDNTELMALSKKPGNQIARSVSVFNSKGLVTDAAINNSGTEVALIGYLGGHQQPFIWLLDNFSGNNFFSGKAKQYQLTEGAKDWQTEGITYLNAQTLLFSCEGTEDVPASLFVMEKSNLLQLKSTAN